jgi:hypothetical protein
MDSDIAAGGAIPEPMQETHSPTSEKVMEEANHLEAVSTLNANLMYTQDDEEPELHARTYFAVAAMFLLNMVQVLSLQGPPAVVSNDNVTYFLDKIG